MDYGLNFLLANSGTCAVKCLFDFIFYIYFLCVREHVCVRVCTTARVEVEDNFQESVLSFFYVVLEIKLGSTALAASAFIYRVILPALKYLNTIYRVVNSALIFLEV